MLSVTHTKSPPLRSETFQHEHSGPGKSARTGELSEDGPPWCQFCRKCSQVSAHISKYTFLNRSSNSGIQVQLIQIHFFRGLTTKTNKFPGTQILMNFSTQTFWSPLCGGHCKPTGEETSLCRDTTGVRLRQCLRQSHLLWTEALDLPTY